MHISLEVYGATACQINMKNCIFQPETFGLLWNWNLQTWDTYIKCQILELQFLSQSNSISASNYINAISCCHLMLSHMEHSSVVPTITSSSAFPFIPKNKCHYYDKVKTVQHLYRLCMHFRVWDRNIWWWPTSQSLSLLQIQISNYLFMRCVFLIFLVSSWFYYIRVNKTMTECEWHVT